MTHVTKAFSCAACRYRAPRFWQLMSTTGPLECHLALEGKQESQRSPKEIEVNDKFFPPARI
jgi:hypothetical protein